MDGAVFDTAYCAEDTNQLLSLCFSIMMSLAEDTPTTINLGGEGCMSFVLSGGDTVEPAFLHSVALRVGVATGFVEGLVFVSMTRPDFESLSWADGFTEQHFKVRI